MMTNLDPRADFEYQRPQPEGDQILVQIGLKEDQTVKIGANLPPAIKERLIELLKTNKDLFAWVSSDMPGVDLEFVCHRLSLKPGCIPVAQKKRKMGSKKTNSYRKTGERVAGRRFHPRNTICRLALKCGDGKKG